MPIKSTILLPCLNSNTKIKKEQKKTAKAVLF